MKISRVIVLLLAMTVSYSSVWAKGDVVAGKDKVTTKGCVGCHGMDGLGVLDTYPKLAGQHADYMLHALKAYKSGDRENAIMNGLVANLTIQDMEDLAAYYATQKGLVDLKIDY